MANCSNVYVKVLPKKNGEILSAVDFNEPEWAEFVPLFCAASYGDDGFLKSGTENGFCVDGRWNYTTGLEWTETALYLRWLKDHGIDGVKLEFMETETGMDFINFGRLDITFIGYAADVHIVQFTQNLHIFAQEHCLEIEDEGDYFAVEGVAQQKGLTLLEHSLDEILARTNAEAHLSLPLMSDAVVKSMQAAKQA